METTVIAVDDYYDLKTFALGWHEDRLDETWFQLIGVDDVLTLNFTFEVNRL